MTKPVIAVTIGDYNGIGPEVAIKAVSDPAILRLCRPVLVGPWPVFRESCRLLRRTLRDIAIIEPPGVHRFAIEPGRVSVTAGRTAIAALTLAAQLAMKGRVDALVTAPVSKKAMHRAGIASPGQTEFLREITGARHAGMMLIAGRFRVGLLTIHVALRQVPSMITGTRVKETVLLFRESLKTDWSIPRPKMALLGLNPHAGEQGDIGVEEETILKPVIRQLRRGGVDIEGPFPADAFFARQRQRAFDAVIASYHDQGLIPLKMAAGGKGVNVTVGLPVIRTSPDHGTAFDIAGKGVADPSSMMTAIVTAAMIALHRFRKKGQQP